MNGVLQLNTLRKGLSFTKNWITKQSPVILTVIGVGGVITTTIMAVRATTEAERLIEEKKVEKGLQVDENLTIEETVETCWKTYVPTVVSGVLTIAAIIGSSAISQKRQAALAGIYAISETTLKEWQDKIVEKDGEKKRTEIKDAIAKDHFDAVEKKGLNPSPLIVAPGDVPVIEAWTGREFVSSVQKLKDAAHEIREGILIDMCASLNEFYDLIGLSRVPAGDEVGWDVSNLIELDFTSVLSSSGTPYLYLDYRNRPTAAYRDI